jgi:hypothetical protein
MLKIIICFHVKQIVNKCLIDILILQHLNFFLNECKMSLLQEQILSFFSLILAQYLDFLSVSVKSLILYCIVCDVSIKDEFITRELCKVTWSCDKFNEFDVLSLL